MRSSILATCLGTAAALQVATHSSLNNTEAEGLEGGNLCMNGRLAPKFFLLGTPKSGTTYFFEDFARSDQIVSYEPGPDEPTWHAKEPWVFADGLDPSRKEWWLSHYPTCAQAKHMVAVDCTPGYFGNQEAPFSIHNIYGGAHSLVFMVFLREPVDRAHSHYYQYEQNGVLQGYFGGCTPQQFPKTFAHAVERRLGPNQNVCNCGCDNIFEDSMYVDSFKRYFKNFPASMFHVVPFKMAVTGEVVEYAWKLLNVQPGHGEKSDLVGGGNEKNHHDYPSLEQEMPAALLSEFQSFMAKMAGPEAVAQVLAGSGAHIYGYHHEEQGVPAVANLFSENW